MKILAVSDQVENRLYSPLLREKFGDVDLLIGCGDLPFEYLEYMLTCLDVPLLYVPGNHDPAHRAHDPLAQVEGGSNIDRRVVKVKGLTIAGLGGSIRYRPGGANQYSQTEMYWRALSLIPRMGLNKLKTGQGADILVTHSPPEGIHDDTDPAHNGLRAINLLMRLFRPRLLLHGHTHNYRTNLINLRTQAGKTVVINVFPYATIEI